MGANEIIERLAERATGMSVETIRSTPLCKLRGMLCGRDSYAGLQASDRKYVRTSAQINYDLDATLRL